MFGTRQKRFSLSDEIQNKAKIKTGCKNLRFLQPVSYFNLSPLIYTVVFVASFNYRFHGFLTGEGSPTGLIYSFAASSFMYFAKSEPISGCFKATSQLAIIMPSLLPMS